MTERSQTKSPTSVARSRSVFIIWAWLRDRCCQGSAECTHRVVRCDRRRSPATQRFNDLVDNSGDVTHCLDLLGGHGHVDVEPFSDHRCFLSCRATERTADLPPDRLADTHIPIDRWQEYERSRAPLNLTTQPLIFGMNIRRIRHEARRQGDDVGWLLGLHQPPVYLDVLSGICAVAVLADVIADVTGPTGKMPVQIEEHEVESLHQTRTNCALASPTGADESNCRAITGRVANRDVDIPND